MPSMAMSEVLVVLAALSAAGCRVWVGGGWGIDALAGQQTRPHRDLDLAVVAADEASALRVLERRGYRVETDWRPVRVELSAPGRGWVDLHPLVFDSTRRGRQAAADGGHFDYPPDGFAEGALDGVPVPCLSAVQQRRFHQGYQLRDVDRHDLAVLDGLDGPDTPNGSATPDAPAEAAEEQPSPTL